MSPFRRISLLMAAGSLLAAAIATPAQAARPESARPTSPPKILIYGDSLTQSFNADWTWRYRLWQSLTASGQSFDFVGPRNDVVEYMTWKIDNQGYRNPDFDRDHAALANMRFLNGYYQVAPLARTYKPNVIVSLIGGNDVIKGASVADLEEHWRRQIAQARAFDRGVDFVLVPVPHIWINGMADYNTVLSKVASALDTPDERVIVAPLAELTRLSDTFDHVHLTTSGQHKVAAVVSQALASLGIGGGSSVALSADPADDHTWAPQPEASLSGVTVTVTWPAVTYASSQNVWARDPATGAVGVKRYVTGQTTTFTGVAGRSYEIWLEPVKGYLPIGTTSHTIRVDMPAA